nr:E3 ubiquitin-protein ligase Topors-like [Anas platyrhynchos]
MDCDCVALAAHMRAQSPSAPASARTPAERLREVWSEERGWPWCWCRALGVAAAALSALPRAIRASSTALRRSGRRETQEERSQQQSVTAAGAAAVRRSSPSSPAPRSPLQQLESMATALESRCPICLDTWDNAGYVMPCLHQFCFRCIQRWVESKPECPLCKRRVSSIVHSVRADNEFEELIIPAPAEASLITQPAGRARGRAATTTPVTVLQHHHQLQGRLLWEASSLKFGPPFSETTQR